MRLITPRSAFGDCWSRCFAPFASYLVVGYNPIFASLSGGRMGLLQKTKEQKKVLRVLAIILAFATLVIMLWLAKFKVRFRKRGEPMKFPKWMDDL